jgi:hypothetical protein
MAIKRLKPPPHHPNVYYHCFSRTAGQHFLFGDVEKDQFIRWAREYAAFCGITLLTYEVLSNHFHLELQVMKKSPTLPDDQFFLDRLACLSTKQAKRDAKALIQYRQEGNHEAAEALRQTLYSRMGDISKFMKLLLERFSQWVNKRQERKGTLWEGPYGCELTEGTGPALIHQCAYIDLNAVRALIVPDPADYRWGGYAQALAGEPIALKGLSIVVGAYLQEAPESLSREKILETYRCLLYIKGVIEGYDQEGKPLRMGFSREECLKVFAEGGKLPREAYLRMRVGYMTRGLAIGSREFIEEVFEANRHLFGRKRKTGARRIRGLAGVELYSLRDLRKKVLS